MKKRSRLDGESCTEARRMMEKIQLSSSTDVSILDFYNISTSDPAYLCYKCRKKLLEISKVEELRDEVETVQ